MEFTVKKGDILKELNLVQGVVERRNTIPILSNLLLEAQGANLFITATDLEVSIKCTCPADIRREGSLAVSAKKLFDIVRLMPVRHGEQDSDIYFSSVATRATTSGSSAADSADWLSVTCQTVTFKIAGIPKDNFPVVPDSPAAAGDGAKWVALPGSVLKRMINCTIFAISQEESRYTLTGALMVLKPDSIRMVTTDGHRLALITKRMTVEGVDEEIKTLIPKKTLSELLKLIQSTFSTQADGDDVVKFARDENHLFFEVGRRLLVSRALAGQFPNYELVIPKENEKCVVLNTESAREAIRRAEIMADERSHTIKLRLLPEVVEVTSSSLDLGEAKEVITPISVTADRSAAGTCGESKGIDKEPMEIGFNAQYLLDFLSAVGSEATVFAFKDSETQALLAPHTGPEAAGETQDADYDYQYIVMPIRL